MTENEAIEILKYYDKQPYFFSRDASADYAFKMAIQALEEIQAYRAIGTVEEIMDMLFSTEQEHDEVLKYRAIGTIEEFKALKETTVTQSDIDAFKAYIDDCMDDVAFGNTDWNHSFSLALKCMELHKS